MINSISIRSRVLRDSSRVLFCLICAFTAAVVVGSAGCGGGESSGNSGAVERLRLSKPTGPFQLWVNSYPESAMVTLDDSIFGSTPLSVESIAPGEYHLKLRLVPFVTVDTTITIGDTPLELPPFILEREIMLESNPPGAEVSINGSPTDKQTPMQMRVAAIDTVKFSFHYTGLDSIWLSAVNPATEKATIPAGQFWEFEEDSSSGRLAYIGSFLRDVTIQTVPSGAEITLAENDSLIGYSEAPLAFPFGKRGYVLSKPGFDTKSVLLDISSSSQSPYVYDLMRHISITAIAASGPDDEDIHADIPRSERGFMVSFIDAITPTTLTLIGTEQRLFFTAPGFEDTSVVIGAYDTTLTVRMRRLGDLGESVTAESHESTASKPGLVTFVVLDKNTEFGIADAEIIAKIKSEDRLVLLGTTDSQGRFSQDLTAGKYEFRISSPGYKMEQKKHTVKAGESKVFEISLKRD